MPGHFEAKKHAYRQTQDGIVVSFVIHPGDVDAEFAVAPLGTRYMVGFAEISDSGLPVQSKSAPEKVKDRLPFNTLPLSQQAGIRGNDQQFCDFVRESFGRHDIEISSEGAANLIRSYCVVKSRSELDTNDLAAQKWRKLEADYQAYLTDQMYSGQIK